MPPQHGRVEEQTSTDADNARKPAVAGPLVDAALRRLEKGGGLVDSQELGLGIRPTVTFGGRSGRRVLGGEVPQRRFLGTNVPRHEGRLPRFQMPEQVIAADEDTTSEADDTGERRTFDHGVDSLLRRPQELANLVDGEELVLESGRTTSFGCRRRHKFLAAKPR